jgi:hypothetical protein
MNKHYQAKMRKLVLEQLEKGASWKQLAQTWKENMENPLEGNSLFIEVVKIEIEKQLVKYFHQYPAATESLSLFIGPRMDSPEEGQMSDSGLPTRPLGTTDQHFIDVCTVEQKGLFIAAINGNASFTFDSRVRWKFFDSLNEADPDELEALLLHKFEEAKKQEGYKTLKNYANRHEEEFSKKFKDILGSFPIALQWIDLLKEVGEGRIEIAEELPLTETSAPPKLTADDTDTHKRELSYPEVAFILAYEQISVTTKDEAKKHGAQYRKMEADNAPLMLSSECVKVFSPYDRLAGLRRGNNKREMKALRTRLLKIEPHLSEKAKPLFNSEFEKVIGHLEKLAKRTF